MALIIPMSEIFSVVGCPRDYSLKFLSVSNPKYVCSDLIKKENSAKLVGFRVCSRIKDLEPRVILNVDRDLRLYGQFSATVKPSITTSPKKSKEEEEKQNYYVNMGYAIRTLREEFPALFHKELSYEIYRDDIVFKDPFNTYVGIENYKSIFWALRFLGRMFFRALWVDIIGIWQPVENMIMIRWTIHGNLRLPWESRGRLDGTSEYKLDKNGKIFEHRVHNIALNKPSHFQVLNVHELIQSVGCPSSPKPTYFKISISHIKKKALPLSLKLNGFSDYLTSILTDSRGPDAEQSQRT